MIVNVKEKSVLDNRIRSQIDPLLDKMGHSLAGVGITANVVTIVGFLIGVLAAIAIALGNLWWGLVLLLISRLCDGLDGAVARTTAKTDFGGYLDIVLDFAFYGLIPLAFIYMNPAENYAAGAALLLAFYVNGASFLAYGLMAEKRGIDESQRGSKSLLYSVGLAEATETIVVFVLFCLFPNWFSVIAWVFAGVVIFTTISRIIMARREFS